MAGQHAKRLNHAYSATNPASRNDLKRVISKVNLKDEYSLILKSLKSNQFLVPALFVDLGPRSRSKSEVHADFFYECRSGSSLGFRKPRIWIQPLIDKLLT